MKISAEIFSYIVKNFKIFWPQLPSTPQNGLDNNSYKSHNHLPETDNYTDDQEMERLVRMIEETRVRDSLRY